MRAVSDRHQLCSAVLHYAYAMQCYAMLSYAMLGYAMLWLCYVDAMLMLCSAKCYASAMLCYDMSPHAFRFASSASETQTLSQCLFDVQLRVAPQLVPE